jgi:signal transduction histidine kinase/DNA-binding response OmpR family regulator/HAMP domain-containing protein
MSSLNLRAQITGLLVLFISALVLLTVITFNALDNAEERLQNVVRFDAEKLQLLEQVRSTMFAQQRAEKNMILAQAPAEMDRFEQAFNEYDIAYSRLRNQLEPLIDAENRVRLTRLESAQNNYRQVFRRIVEATRKRDNTSAFRLSNVEARSRTDEVEALLDGLVDYNRQAARERLERGEAERQATAQSILLTVVVVGLLVTGIGVYFLNNLISRLNRLTEHAQRVSQGDYSQVLEDTRQDELRTVYDAFNQNVLSFRDVIRQAEAVSQGDFSREIEVRSQEDTLSLTLQKMTEQLRNTSAENERQSWFKSGQNELAMVMRGDPEPEVLANSVLKQLVPYLEAQVGVFYLRDGNQLNLLGTYAYRRRNDDRPSYQLHEGLVGQAAQEQKLIIFRDIDPDRLELQIDTGLGTYPPVTVIAMPLIVDNEVLGVIEMGSLRNYSDFEYEFMDRAAESIAVVLNSARARARVNRLLEETRKQAEELEQQQQELQASNEELQSQQEELQAANRNLEEQQRQLETANRELESKSADLEAQRRVVDRKNQELERSGQELERKAEELARSSKYKSEFLANMSHELRTPLNSMLLLSELMKNDQEGNLTPKQIEFLQTIHKSGRDLLSLINEVLDLAKVEAGKMDLHPESTPLNTLADELLARFDAQASQKKLQLQQQIAEHTPAEITVDRQRLEQILRNLLSNAVKFTESGSVTLHIGRPAPATEDLISTSLTPETTVAFSVTDTGPGIPQEKQSLLFEAFQQLDGSISRKYGGTGLGLSISRELALLLGGVIRLSSQPGQGSTFTLYLPETAPEREEEPTASAPSTPLPSVAPEPQGMEPSVPHTPSLAPASAKASKPVPRAIPDDRDHLAAEKSTLLIVEDDPTFAAIVAQFARDRAFQVLHAPDGESALELAAEHQPQGIVLDIDLPGINGWHVLSELKKSQQTRHIPVHFMSGLEQPDKVREAGAIGFLSKPASQGDLAQALGRIEEIAAKKVKNLLLVEDDDATLTALQELVRSDSIDVEVARNGNDALEILRQGHSDCVVLDLRLGDMSGFDLLELLLKEKIECPPVIIYTGAELTREQERTLHRYTDSIVIKGVQSQERLLSEITLFLHTLGDAFSREKQMLLHKLAQQETELAGNTVLLVDDDARNTYALTQLLEQQGLIVLPAFDGNEALQVLDAHPEIRIVLMDIMMPEMDGYECTRRIRSNPDQAHLPIIALTAKAMREDRKKCLDAGANDYLTKPVDTTKLLSLMRVWLQK